MLNSKRINLAKLILKNNNIKYYLINYSDEFLNEIIPLEENLIYNLTGFKGENSYLLISSSTFYLFVDGRFTIEAKKYIKDKNIKIITFSSIDDIINKINVIIKKDFLYIDYRFFSIDFVEKIKDKFKIKNSNKLYNKLINIDVSDKYNLIYLDNKYKTCAIDKIKSKLNEVTKNNNFNYITSNPEEISYITNLRKIIKTANINNDNNDFSYYSVLCDGYLIINNKQTTLYTNYNYDKKLESLLKKHKIIIYNKDKFYIDVKNYKNVFIDKTINSYKLKQSIKSVNYIDSPIKSLYSIKSALEIKNIKKANIIDGISMLIFNKLINNLDFNNLKLTEYDIKLLIDGIRNSTEKKYFNNKTYITPSFDTIVAYKDNSSICHYVPTKDNSKVIKNDSILLVDSGGHYKLGTTDITRVYSLYKNKIPLSVKNDYTLVLKTLINTSMQVFLYGTKGTNIDYYARTFFYNNLKDFNHGLGHGIGFMSNVHEGVNRLSRLKTAGVNNVLNINNVQSIEPGIYYENKYGIRLENDTFVKLYKKNKYGDFYNFETLTLCPFEQCLINKKLLNENEIKYINIYHKKVYDELSKHVDKDLKKFLKELTTSI